MCIWSISYRLELFSWLQKRFRPPGHPSARLTYDGKYRCSSQRFAERQNKAISFPSKTKLYTSLVLSILLYGCDSWTLTAELERQIQCFQNNCYRSMLGISCKERKTNEYGSGTPRSISAPEVMNFHCQPSNVASYMVRPYLQSRSAAKIILRETVDRRHRSRRPRNL